MEQKRIITPAEHLSLCQAERIIAEKQKLIGAFRRKLDGILNENAEYQRMRATPQEIKSRNAIDLMGLKYQQYLSKMKGINITYDAARRYIERLHKRIENHPR